jgi:hypothetical protein
VPLVRQQIVLHRQRVAVVQNVGCAVEVDQQDEVIPLILRHPVAMLVAEWLHEAASQPCGCLRHSVLLYQAPLLRRGVTVAVAFLCNTEVDGRPVVSQFRRVGVGVELDVAVLEGAVADGHFGHPGNCGCSAHNFAWPAGVGATSPDPRRGPVW